MKLNTSRIIRGVRTHYDRLMAGLILVLLLGSLLYLVMLVGGAKSMRQRLERELETLRPTHEYASKIDVGPYRAAVNMLEQPDTLNYEAWTNALTVPERRVWCVDCRMPIPFDARVCDFCGHVQPKPKGERKDWDKDGMKDEWEREHGLDPNDPSDAAADADGDGYSNLEEFEAGTDPNDPEDFPPPEKDLRLVRFDAERFPLEFFSRARMPDGSLQFGINSATLDQT
ncbi:MAG: Amuc_1099 family pilus-like system protein, partial [Verrucomicrobiota bacterium]